MVLALLRALLGEQSEAIKQRKLYNLCLQTMVHSQVVCLVVMQLLELVSAASVAACLFLFPRSAT